MVVKLFGAFTLIIGGIIVADVLIHPEGTQAATNGLANILTPTYSALLGGYSGTRDTGYIQQR